MRELLKLNQEKLLFFDIETTPVVKELELDSPLYDSWEYKKNKEGKMTSDEIIESYSKEAGLYPEFTKIICIVVGKIIGDKINLITLKSEDEATILNQFNQVLNRNSQDRLVGFVNTGFDTPFVFKRMLINGIKPSDKVDSSGLKPWEVEEVDLSKMWQGTSFNRASLINIATAFGLPSPKDDISGADVGRVYWEGGLDRIATYCEKDVVTTINIFRKMRLQEPLEVANKPTPQKPKGLLEVLFNGGDYSKKEEGVILERLKSMSKKDQEAAITIMNALVSGAKGKETNLTKAAVNRFKKALKDG